MQAKEFISKGPRVRFLTAIWGERYIEEFSRISLLSFLSPGNLPALAQTSDLEVLILTSEASLEVFHREPAFKALQAICSVKFIVIDDLIATGNYGVTLTLAYARGIQDSGAEQTNTYFVFMNSDFVLADGSLKTLSAKIAAGQPCIMAPSLRACSEAVMPVLANSVDRATGYLALPSRKLVQIAFDNLHPTVIGKTVTQNFIRCTTHNQIYWQVDPATFLGRYHLIFMLAIKPERPMPPVNSYCDYGFVPELVPSGTFAILNDSDDFFMLELQPARQERQYLLCGRPNLREIARELSVWTTREHRRFADVDVVFHAGDLPPSLDRIRKQAAEFMTDLRRMMRKPVDHARHFYWVMGVESWLTRRIAETNKNADSLFPAECGPLYPRGGLFDPAMLRSTYLKILGRLRRVAGAKPKVPIWHHAWLDSRLVLNWIKTVAEPLPRRQLLVVTGYSPLVRFLESTGTFDVIRARDLLDDRAFAQWRNANDGMHYRNVLCHVYHADVLRTRRILERLSSVLGRETMIGIYIDHEEASADPGNFTQELAQYVDDVLPGEWLGLEIKANFVGGVAKRRMRLTEIRLLHCLWPVTWRRMIVFPFVPLLWPFVAVLTAMNNWWRRNGFKTCPSFCSSALLTLRHAPPSSGDGRVRLRDQI